MCFNDERYEVLLSKKFHMKTLILSKVISCLRTKMHLLSQ